MNQRVLIAILFGICAISCSCSKKDSFKERERDLHTQEEKLYWYAGATEALRGCLDEYRAKSGQGRYPENVDELSRWVGNSIPYRINGREKMVEHLKLSDVWFEYLKTDKEGSWFKTRIRGGQGQIGVEADRALLRRRKEP